MVLQPAMNIIYLICDWLANQNITGDCVKCLAEINRLSM